MDRDTFIITVYCLVDEEFKKLRAVYRVRHAGFTPALSDVEVLTMDQRAHLNKKVRFRSGRTLLPLHHPLF